MKRMSFDHELHGPSAYHTALQPDATERVLATQNSTLTTTGAFHPFLECPEFSARGWGCGICRGNQAFSQLIPEVVMLISSPGGLIAAGDASAQPLCKLGCAITLPASLVFCPQHLKRLLSHSPKQVPSFGLSAEPSGRSMQRSPAEPRPMQVAEPPRAGRQQRYSNGSASYLFP